MSLCDRCYAPGACCRDLYLNAHIETGADPDEVMRNLRDSEGRPYPFRVVSERHGPLLYDQPGYEAGRYRWGCDKLSADGRCSIYATRPDTCRLYEPRADALCVHFHLEAGDYTGDESIDYHFRRRIDIDPEHETMGGFPSGVAHDRAGTWLPQAPLAEQ